MKLAIVQKKVDDAFDDHLGKMVDILMQNATGEPEKLDAFVANFHRGLAMSAQAREKVFAELATIFPE